MTLLDPRVDNRGRADRLGWACPICGAVPGVPCGPMVVGAGDVRVHRQRGAQPRQLAAAGYVQGHDGLWTRRRGRRRVLPGVDPQHGTK